MIHATNENGRLSDGLASQYMSLRLGDVTLLARQSDLASLESLRDVSFENPSSGSIGWINFAGHNVPVCSFTDRLGVEHSLSQDKTICAVLVEKGEYIGVMCTEVLPFNRQIVKIQPLPECMQSSPCPIDSLCLYKRGDKREINYTVTAGSVRYFISRHDDQ